jgi:hypothetical protein
MERRILAWEAPEYHHFDKSPDWFWILGIVAISAAILCVLFGNILFAIFILLSAAVAGIFASREPRIINVELQPRGIRAGELFYHYDSLDSFWVDEHHPLPRIILKSQKTLMPHIIVSMADPEHADEVREFLVEYLPEVQHQESFAHHIMERLGL